MNSDEKLNDLAKKSVDEFLRMNPGFATQLGAHEYDDKLDDMSPEFLEEMIHLLKDTRKELDKIDEAGHTELGLIDREVFRSSIDLFLFQLEEIADQERNPDFGGVVGNALFPLFMRDFAPIEERMRCIASRLEQVPRAFGQFKSLVTRPVRLWTQLAIQSVQGIPGFIQLIISVSEAQVSKKLHERLKKAGAVATETLEEAKAWLEGLLPTAHDEWALGPEKFERLLQLRKMPSKTSEILELGENYLRKFKQDLAELAESISPGASTDQVREQLQDDHPSTFEEVLETYRNWVIRARQWVIDNDFATVLDGELRVVETPGFLKPLIPTAALVIPGMFDETKFGEYIVTNADDEENLRRHYMSGIPRTCIHEAYPGHFLQNLGRASAPVSRLLHSELTLIEGWAFYCEQAAIDMGFNDTPEARFSQTLALIWRAARIIIDIKLSRGEMTFEEAVQMLKDEAGMDENRARSEVSRYTMTPGYPLSYLLGRHLIMEVRNKLEEDLGSEFDLKLFHDTIIGAGAIPVSFIPELYRAAGRK